MKYPHLPPAGCADGGPAWQLAGTDLAAAAALAGRHQRTTEDGVMLAEIRHRQGDTAGALAVLSTLEQVALVKFATANCHWTQGDAKTARKFYEHASRLWSEADDGDGILAALLGLSRCARMNYSKKGRAVLSAAIEAAPDCKDIHLLADLHRERAGWALLGGDADEAMRLAEKAAEVHDSVGDRYMRCLADVLRARALNAQQDRADAVTLVRQQLVLADEIGSVDLKKVAVVYLGQFMQRGVVAGVPEWAEAKEVIETALDEYGLDDPFTRAELILPLAHLHTAGGEFAEAEACLAEYRDLYRALGGNKVAEANLLKARARLELARTGGLSLRAVGPLMKSFADFNRARLAYRKAGLEQGAQSVQRQMELIEVLGAKRSRASRMLASDAKDALDRARENLVTGMAMRQVGKLRHALPVFAAAEQDAVAAGATPLAVAAATGSADISFTLGDHSGTCAHLRSAITHAESIRAAVATGTARKNIARTLHGHYEQGLVLAARSGDADLVVEIAERLRTERLAGLLHRGKAALPDDLAGLLRQIERVNDAVLTRFPGVQGVRSVAVIEELDYPGLLEHRVGLYARLSELTSDLFADTYGAEPVQMDRLATVREHVLMLTPVDDGIVSVWRSPTGEGEAVVSLSTPDLVKLREILTGQDTIARLNLTSGSLTPIQALLPPAMVAALAASRQPSKVVIIPTGWLWAVPFAAVPTGDSTVLVNHADLVLTPSLRFLHALRGREAGPRPAVSWRDPDAGFEAPELAGLADHMPLTSSEQVLDAFVRGGDRFGTAVIAAHGNREPGLAHAVLAGGRRPVLTAADFLDGAADPPRCLSLASCHSGYPEGDDQYEPLGLALAALAAGTRHVISAHFEIDSYPGPVTTCLHQIYESISTTAPPSALGDALRNFAGKQIPLYQWAALTVIGTH